MHGGSPVAMVTSESQNELLAVSLPDGIVLRRLRVPAGPENVEAGAGPVVVVSSKARAVSIYAWRTLRLIRRFTGFRDPHLVALGPSGEWAYVTDDATGKLTVIQLAGPKIVNRPYVGAEAHHLAFSPDEKQLWVALGEKARTIVVLDTSRADRPRVVGRIDPGFEAHDLTFSRTGSRVWITSSSDRRVHVFDAKSRRELFAIEIGPPPQHVAFGTRGYAYVTSGYGSRIAMVHPRRGRVLRSAPVPYGSFNVTTDGGLVVTSSLLRGTVTEFDDRLHRIASLKVAPAARDAAISVW
jgi:DNA-binding beta-propeller fold protein YncE